MAVQGLEYIISLNDQLSSPLKGIMATIDDVGVRGRDAMIKIGVGVAGVVAAGVALKSALDPAIDFSRALNEIKATGRGEEGLKKITDFALDFSSTYGGAATDVVNSTNEIARAIDGLTDNELIAFSKSSNILAKATGSDVKAMGSYISQLYGIFGDEAAKIGKEKWVEQIAAQATVTANKFKSSGESLMQAYTNLGSSAKDHGVRTAEQFAVIGNLQNVFEGGLAGTKYAAFLSGAVKAQKKLGLSFLDSQGKMLPIIDILQKIKGKYGELNSENLYELQKAFGTKEAAQVINNLLPKIDSLKADIAEIDKMKTLEEAMAISKAVTDSWMRFQAIFQNIKIAIGLPILAKLEPIMNWVADMGQEFVKWLNTYKNIARWIGYISGLLIGSAGLAAVVAIFSGIVGVLKIVGIAFAALLVPILLVIAKIVLIGVVIYKFRSHIESFVQGFIRGFYSVGVSFEPVFSALSGLWASMKGIGTAIGRLITLIFGASEGMQAFSDIGEVMGYLVAKSLNFIISIISLVVDNVAILADVFGDVTDAIITMWQGVVTGWKNSDPLQIFGALADGVQNIFNNVFEGVKNMFINMLNWIIGKANSLSGLIGIEIPVIPTTSANGKFAETVGNVNPIASVANLAGAIAGSAALPAPNSDGQHFAIDQSAKADFKAMPKGNITKHLNSTENKYNTVNFGGVTINSSNGEDVWKKMKERAELE